MSMSRSGGNGRPVVEVIVFERDEGEEWTASAATSAGETIAVGQGPSILEARARLDAALNRVNARFKENRDALSK